MARRKKGGATATIHGDDVTVDDVDDAIASAEIEVESNGATFMHEQREVDLKTASVATLHETIKGLKSDAKELVSVVQTSFLTEDIDCIVACLSRVRDLCGEMRTRAARIVKKHKEG